MPTILTRDNEEIAFQTQMKRQVNMKTLKVGAVFYCACSKLKFVLVRENSVYRLG